MTDTFDHTSTDAAKWAAEFKRLFPESDEGTMLGWFANAIMAGMDEGHRRHREIGVLTYDNGEFDVYVSFFHDPRLLEVAVARLREERRDYNTGDDADCEAKRIALDTASVVDDDLLDRLADLLNESGADIEDGVRAAERRAEEEAERLAEESIDRGPALSPGQIALDGSVVG